MLFQYLRFMRPFYLYFFPHLLIHISSIQLLFLLFFLHIFLLFSSPHRTSGCEPPLPGRTYFLLFYQPVRFTTNKKKITGKTWCLIRGTWGRCKWSTIAKNLILHQPQGGSRAASSQNRLRCRPAAHDRGWGCQDHGGRGQGCPHQRSG
jgi:hypothetical protein